MADDVDCTSLQTDADWTDSWAFYTAYTSSTVNTPRDLTGYIASAGAKGVGSDDAPMAISTANGLLTIQANVVSMKVPSANASKVALPLGNVELDLVLIDGSGNRQGGIFQVYQNRQGHAA